jgi:hypothetical protein
MVNKRDAEVFIVCLLMRGDPLGVARSSRIHEICGGEEDEHEEHDEHDTQIEGQTHTHKIHTGCPSWTDSPTQ